LDPTETTMTLAQGLPNCKYNLEVAGGDATPIAAIGIYQPPLGRNHRSLYTANQSARENSVLER